MPDRLEDLYSAEFKKKLPAYRKKFEKQIRESDKSVTEAQVKRAQGILDRLIAQQPDTEPTEDVADHFREHYLEYRLGKPRPPKGETDA